MPRYDRAARQRFAAKMDAKRKAAQRPKQSKKPDQKPEPKEEQMRMFINAELSGQDGGRLFTVYFPNGIPEAQLAGIAAFLMSEKGVLSIKDVSPVTTSVMWHCVMKYEHLFDRPRIAAALYSKGCQVLQVK